VSGVVAVESGGVAMQSLLSYPTRRSGTSASLVDLKMF